MAILMFLATAMFIQAPITHYQDVQALPVQPALAKPSVWSPEPMAQITPVHQLTQPLDQLNRESLSTERSLLQNRVDTLETRNSGVADFSYEIERGRRAERASPSQFHSRIKQCRNSHLEVQQFSPTASLEGEVLLGVIGATGSDIDEPIVLQSSVELTLNVSFTGEDRLEVGLESGNATAFPFVDELTFEGQLDFPASTDENRFELSELSYEFPIGDRTSVYLSTTGNDLNDFNPFFDRNDDSAFSKFGAGNPIQELVEDTGLQLNYNLTDNLGIGLGYFSGEADDPEQSAGLFNGDQSLFVQLEFESGDREEFLQEPYFLLGLTYIRTYRASDLETDTGSVRSQLNLGRPIVGNSYGIAASFSPVPQLMLGGWFGLTDATVLGLGDATVLNYALTVALADVGQEGNFLYIVLGQEPRLTGTSGLLIEDRDSDPDTSFHIEAFYSHQLSDHIAIMPGFVWITAPNHDTSNPDILIFAIKTTFRF